MGYIDPYNSSPFVSFRDPRRFSSQSNTRHLFSHKSLMKNVEYLVAGEEKLLVDGKFCHHSSREARLCSKLLTNRHIVEKKVCMKIENLAATPTVDISDDYGGTGLFFFFWSESRCREGRFQFYTDGRRSCYPVLKLRFTALSDSWTSIYKVAGALDALSRLGEKLEEKHHTCLSVSHPYS